jgi:hypothetical protein
MDFSFRSKIYSVEAGWTLRSLLYCRFHCIDKGQFKWPKILQRRVLCLIYGVFFFPLEDNSDFIENENVSSVLNVI